MEGMASRYSFFDALCNADILAELSTLATESLPQAAHLAVNQL